MGETLDRVSNENEHAVYRDIALVVDISASSYPDAWISYGVTQFGFKFAAAVTAVMATDYYPYLQSGQMIGLIGGLKGAAEYEHLLDDMEIDRGKFEVLKERIGEEAFAQLQKNRMKARVGMDAQTVVHVFIILLIILGNVIFFFFKEQAKFVVND